MKAIAQSQFDLILTRLDAASDLPALRRAVYECREILGVEHAVYHWVSSAGENYSVCTYPDEWVEHYTSQDYVRIDPVILGCYQRFDPVNWKKLDWSGRPARQLRQEAAEFRIGNQGYSIPLRGPNGQFALFTLNHTCDDVVWAAFTNQNSRNLILIAHAFNRKALELEPVRGRDAGPPLSPREVDALTLLALGHSRAQVAQALSISEHTLRAYIETARRKLGAANTVHAVARALTRGAIIV